MIFKEINLPAAMQLVVEGKTSELFFGTENGLCAAKERRFYLGTMKDFKWFKRIPKETELKKED